MKILDIPQSGKRGLNVSQNSRNGLVSRALVIPTNPQTDAQMRVRSFLRSVASKWSSTLPVAGPPPVSASGRAVGLAPALRRGHCRLPGRVRPRKLRV